MTDFEIIAQRLTEIRDLLKYQSKADQDGIVHGVNGLAEYLGCSPRKAQYLKNEGILPYMQFGRIVMFSKADVLEALKDNTNKRLISNIKNKHHGIRDHSECRDRQCTHQGRG